MLYREIIAACSEIHVIHTVGKTEFLNVKLVLHEASLQDLKD
jgi:hypothetical protein